MSDLALLFPGQGSQTADMWELVYNSRPDLLEAVGDEPFQRAGESTRFAQPAIFCASLASYERAGRPAPRFVAGHSLGELAALVVAGALSEEDGLRLVTLRGRLMADAVAAAGGGGMLALLGGEAGSAASLAERHGLTVANDNAPGQAVVSGPADAIDAAADDATAEGLRAMRLAVEGAFHSPDMRPAAKAFAEALADTHLYPARATVVSCTSAQPFKHVRQDLADAIVAPVRWRQTLLALHAFGARRFADAGPGKVLAGLVKRTLENVAVETLVTPEPVRA